MSMNTMNGCAAMGPCRPGASCQGQMGEWHLSAAPNSACLGRDGESLGETPHIRPSRGHTNILTRWANRMSRQRRSPTFSQSPTRVKDQLEPITPVIDSRQWEEE